MTFTKSPSKLVRFSSQSEVLAAFKSGRVGIVDSNILFNLDAIADITFSKLMAEYSENLISLHSQFSKDEKYEQNWTSIHKLGMRLSQFQEKPIPPPSAPERESFYGVVNIRRLTKKRFIQPNFLKNFGHSFSFLWMGLSPGGFHFDEFNNVLLQLSGRKRVVCFDPIYADTISHDHYLTILDDDSLFSDKNIQAYPGLAKVPYFEAELKAGDALILPSAAYHAPKAMSFDSVSLNAFFTPRLQKSYLSRHSRKETPFPWMIINTAISLSKLSYQLVHYPLIKNGHYEVM